MCLGYGGGGHEAAGACPVANEAAERVEAGMIAALNPVRRAA